MVVHLRNGGFTVDANEPIRHIPIGLHWVRFEEGLWNIDEYRSRLQGLYEENQAPAYRPGVTPLDITLDQVRDDGVLKIKDEPGIVGDHRDSFRHLLISNAKQTGDVPHIAAAMVHDPMLDVIIVHTPQDEATVKDMRETYERAIGRAPAAATSNSYTSLRRSGDRVRTLEEAADAKYGWYNALIPGDTGRGVLGPPKWRSKQSDHDHIYTYDRGDGALVEYKMMYVGGATTLVADTYTAKGAARFFSENTHALTADIPDAEIATFFKNVYGFDLDDSKGKYLLVWSRYSGRKPGGYNPAGDSSVTGNAQLIELAAKTGRIAVSIGHDPPNGKTQTPHGKIHLGEFWNHPDTTNPFRGKGRPGQTNFYAFLRSRHDVIQVGQKTGGMDNAALVGMPTVYIEDVRSPQQGRMIKWVKAMEHYRCAAVKQPPTRLGKAIREMAAMSEVLTTTHRADDDNFASAQDLRDNYKKGYEEEDRKRIEEEIRKLES